MAGLSRKAGLLVRVTGMGLGLCAVALEQCMAFTLDHGRCRGLARGLRRRIRSWQFRLLGPGSVKLAQFLAVRPDLAGQRLAKWFNHFLDELPPPGHRDVRHVFCQEFGQPPESLYCNFDVNAVAAGSIASVYRATLADGRTVAVKVLRPGVAESIRRDLNLMRQIAELMAKWPRLRKIPVVAAMDEVVVCLENQVDFTREREMAERLRAELAWEDHVRIPCVIREYCSRSVLTMEWLENLSREPGKSTGTGGAVVSALRALYRMIFVIGAVHCDMHSGNLYLFPAGECALVDFGFVVELSDNERLLFAEFFYCISTNQGRRCAEILLEMASQPDRDLLDYPREGFFVDIESLVCDVCGKNVEDFQIGLFVTRLFAIQARHGVVSSTRFTMVIVALMMLEGMLKRIEPTADFQRIAQPYIFRAAFIQPSRRRLS